MVNKILVDEMSEVPEDNKIKSNREVLDLKKTLDKFASTLLDPATKKKPGRASKYQKQTAFEVEDDTDGSLVDVLNGILQQISLMRIEMISSNKRFDCALTKISNLEKENGSLKSQMATNDGKISELESRCDRLENQSRLNEVIVTGAAVSSEGENLKDSMVDLLSNTLKIPRSKLQKYDFKKIGRGSNTVAVKVPDKSDKIAMFSAARLLKPQHLFVNESLIKSRRDLFYELRKMKRESIAAGQRTFHSVFSLKGEIFIRKTEHSTNIIQVRSISDLDGMF